MIAVNGHIFRTLADPIYVNGTVVKEVYANGVKVYPEGGKFTVISYYRAGYANSWCSAAEELLAAKSYTKADVRAIRRAEEIPEGLTEDDVRIVSMDWNSISRYFLNDLYQKAWEQYRLALAAAWPNSVDRLGWTALPSEGEATTDGVAAWLYVDDSDGYPSLCYFTEADDIYVCSATGTSYHMPETKLFFYEYPNLEDLSGIADWDVSCVTDMSRCFENLTKIASLESLEKWRPRNVKKMERMFYCCTALDNIDGLANWDTGSLENASYMFFGCGKLKSVDGLAKWDTHNLVTTSYMFAGEEEFRVGTGYVWTTPSGLTNVNGMNDWDVSKLEDMSYMFHGCTGLRIINGLAHWSTQSLKNMEYAFSHCESLGSVWALKEWDISKLTTLNYVFTSCTTLFDISALGFWDVSSIVEMEGTFSFCRQLTDIQALQNWDVGSVENMTAMFCTCSALQNISPLRDWDVSRVGPVRWIIRDRMAGDYGLVSVSDGTLFCTFTSGAFCSMFLQCSSLRDVSPLRNWDVSNAENMSGMFADTALTNANVLESWNIGGVNRVIYESEFNSTDDGLRGMFYHLLAHCQYGSLIEPCPSWFDWRP